MQPDDFSEWCEIDKQSSTYARLRWEQDHFIYEDMVRAYTAGYEQHRKECMQNYMNRFGDESQ